MMNSLMPYFLGLAVIGFAVGLFVRPGVVLRIAVGLFMLAGLAMLLTNTAGWETASYWSAASMAGIAVVFGVAIIAAAAGRLVRRLVRQEPPPRPRDREYNSII